ncbi:hypothetical protein ACIGZI_12265 [Streptomyces griseus]|uniref:hypothetical protein n=1 Tax=Streptomyces griseus TaxID=1911 RepID=UPI003328D9D0
MHSAHQAQHLVAAEQILGAGIRPQRELPDRQVLGGRLGEEPVTTRTASAGPSGPRGLALRLRPYRIGRSAAVTAAAG